MEDGENIHSERFRILALDDDPDVLDVYRLAVQTIVSSEGKHREVDVTCCSTGEEALAAVNSASSTNRPYALIFLDLRSGMDGVSVGEKIRKADPHANFVIITGRRNVPLEEIVRRLPPEDRLLYLQKPFGEIEVRQFISAIGAKWRSERQLARTHEELARKVSELEESRKSLLLQQHELESVNNRLLETNNALSVLVRNIEKARKDSELRTLKRTVTLILPIIEKLQTVQKLGKYRKDLDLLKGYVDELSQGGSAETKAAGSLSDAEYRIASMIRQGLTSREIAANLNISLLTVKTHRKNIRRKLQLRRRPIGLKDYLVSESAVIRDKRER